MVAAYKKHMLELQKLNEKSISIKHLLYTVELSNLYELRYCRNGFKFELTGWPFELRIEDGRLCLEFMSDYEKLKATDEKFNQEMHNILLANGADVCYRKNKRK